MGVKPASAVADFSESPHFLAFAPGHSPISDFARPYTPANPRLEACTHTGWGLSGLSYAPAWPYTQQCGYFESSLALWGIGNECVESGEAWLTSPLTGTWSSWTGPLTMSLRPMGSESVEQAQSPAEPGQVDPKLTQISGSLAARELKRAWMRLLNETPSDDVALIITAHWAHETFGGRQMYNYNFGGIKGHAPDGRSCVREALEGSGFHVKALLDRFRAYQSVRAGAEDYLSLLIRKYPEAISAAERGDVTDFVAALKRGRYFTGSESDYARSLSKLVVHAGEFGFDVLSTDKN